MYGWLIPAWILGAPFVGAIFMLMTDRPSHRRDPLP